MILMYQQSDYISAMARVFPIIIKKINLFYPQRLCYQILACQGFLLIIVKFIMSTRDREEKPSENQERQTSRTVKKRVVSEFTTYSDQQNQPIQPIKPAILENFSRRNISYNPHMPYEPFTFEVERIAPSLNFFRIKIKIAHFSLTISAAKVPQLNVLASHQISRGSFASIYSLSLGEEILCLKSFNFDAHSTFQKLFPRVVKEWAVYRICEALECAPYIPLSLGFDLLIFDDCIQYATEMGQMKYQFSTKDANYLKEELTLLHSFKIMHLDIKPQNIVFSKYFGKPVFIDFGFSQIIEEDLGLKTLTSFKGTPNFCSPEMLAIMLETQGYVDLYHNDMNGLQAVIKCNLIKFLEQFEEDQSEEEDKCQEKVHSSQTNILYAFYAFQYYYLQSNAFKARFTLSLCLKIEESNVKKILMFIKKTMRLMFIKEIFENDLRKYYSLAEYKEIEEEQRINIGKFFYKTTANQPSQMDEDSGSNNSSEFKILSFIAGAQLNQSFQHYLNVLLNLIELQDKNVINFIAITFQCIRFDVRNLEFSEKKQIAVKMNALISKYLQRDELCFAAQDEEESIPLHVDEEQKSLNHIKVLLLLIFELCLTHKPQQDKWIKKHIFDVCQQMILLDICFLQHIDKLSQYVQDNFTEPMQEALVMLQFSRLSNTAKIIESEQMERQELLQKEFFNLTWKWIIKFKSSSQFTLEKEIISIRRVLFFFQQLRTNNAEYPHHQQDIMKGIQDLDIRKYLLLCLTDHKINHYFDAMSHQQIFNISQFAKHSSDLRNLDLLSSITITMKTLVGAYNIQGIIAFCKHIQSVINCPIISKTLHLKDKILKHNPPGKVCIDNQVKLVLERYQKSTKKDSTNRQILEILTTIDKKNLRVNDQVKQDLIKLYALYRQHKQRKQSEEEVNQIPVQQFAHIYYDIKLQYYFFRFFDLTKEVFLNNLKREEQQNLKIVEILKEIPEVNDFKYFYSSYKVRLYQFYFYLHHQHVQLCLSSLAEVQKILKCLSLNSLILETMKTEIKITVSWQKMPLIQSAVYRLYNYCCEINYKSFYLLQKNIGQTFASLVVFQSTNPSLFYSLLKQLTFFLVAHPIQSYFMYLLCVLEKIWNHRPEYVQALHYSHFEDMNLKENPYLLVFYAFSLKNQEPENQLKLFKKIALNCDRLNPYAKTKILQKHFAVYLNYLSYNYRNKRVFLFRRMKHFICQTTRVQINKSLIKTKRWKGSKYEMMKDKMKHYREHLI